MLNEPTIEKLRALRLDGLLEAWQEQQSDATIGALAFDERLGMLVDAEWLRRENKRLTRALKEAKLKLDRACIEDIEYPARRQLDRATVRQLAQCRWVAEHQQILISGATGTGKTYLACALANQACRKGYRALYRRTSRLFQELTLAHADGTFPRLLGRIARLDVLVLDDFLLTPLHGTDSHDLLEILDDRYGMRSTIVTSQLPPTHWHEVVGDPSIADSICDRLLSNAHKIAIHGPSRRPTKEKNGK
jgi:DNA replication protein DnaC